MSETRLTSLADLPTSYAEKQQATFDEERAAARRKNQQAHEHIAREKRKRRAKPGKLMMAAITWLPEPVPVMSGSRTLVHGVASDASDEVKREWL